MEDVDAALRSIEEAGRGKSLGQQVDAIKTQMLYRKQVLKQVLKDPKGWCFSEQCDGRCYIFKAHELAQHIKNIISES